MDISYRGRVVAEGVLLAPPLGFICVDLLLLFVCLLVGWFVVGCLFPSLSFGSTLRPITRQKL